MSERAVIARLRGLFPRIGDDAAVIGDQVFTTDMLVENVDFTRDVPLELIARKALGVNLSDLAAMGAKPAHALVAVAFPPWALEGIDRFFGALGDAAKTFGIEIIGGDLSNGDKLVVAVTAIGAARRPLLRTGARTGDGIYLSRAVGGSGAGLELLKRGWSWNGDGPTDATAATRAFAAAAIRRHLDPEPEIELGLALAPIAEVTSCIDLSDGLSTDLHNLCEASRCGAEIELERIPVFPDLAAIGPSLGIRPRELILHGGEEYALLFTSSLEEVDLAARLERSVHFIGRVTDSKDIVLKEEGSVATLAAGGYEHFSRGAW